MSNSEIFFSSSFSSNNSYQLFKLSDKNTIEEILSPEAIRFLLKLHHNFETKRIDLLKQRENLAKSISFGVRPQFSIETAEIRNSQWHVAACPSDLQKRHVEITGPAEAKMIVNALNSEADVFMADLEDSLSPTWENIILGQKALKEANKKNLEFSLEGGKLYKLNSKVATLLVRPRGLHLVEKNFLIHGESMSASLFDFGLYFFHNAKIRLQNNSAPYFYLPKLESYLEARWWNEVFNFSQDFLQIPRGSIRATILIETCLAALQMDEILFELKSHASGLNAGRWDYIFSFIKKFKDYSDFIFPDRGLVTMTAPFMQSYCELIVQTCHKRNAHAIGGMSAFIPNRKEPEVTEKALQQVRADKSREANMGFDGTWVAHPDLVPIARSEFNLVLKSENHQKNIQIKKNISEADLLNIKINNSKITESGARTNINVALLYLDRWLNGVGAAALYNLMEDAATAEISRSELWQWIKFKCTLDDGRLFNEKLYQEFKNSEVDKILNQQLATDLKLPIEILDALVLSSNFHEFLTTYSYKHLN